jgi:MFS family permease
VAEHGKVFRAAFAVREFRAVWGAEALSQVGDQLARVALAVLVFDRTGSAALVALTLGLSYTPSLLGSALLSGLADRLPRREVMIGCDLVSMSLVILMAIPGMPLAVVCTAMAGVALVGGPFRAARLALLPEMLGGEAYIAALAVRSMTIQAAQLIGFVGGGVVVALISPRVALLVDGVTFLASALALRFLVERRPAPQHVVPGGGAGEPVPRRFWASSVHGARVIASIPGLPALFTLAMLAGFYIGPEGLAAAWVVELDAPEAAVGLLMGAPAAGLILGAWLFTNQVDPAQRLRLTGPLAIAAGLVLAVCALRPGLPITLAVLLLSGMCTAYQVQVGASFGRSTPPESRAQVMGLLNSGVLTTQGVGMLLAGVLAEYVGVARTVAIAGVAGAIVAVPATMALSRTTADRGEGVGKI